MVKKAFFHGIEKTKIHKTTKTLTETDRQGQMRKSKAKRMEKNE